MYPQYDAVIVPDTTAYPSIKPEAKRLVRALTGRDDAEPLDWERTCQVTFALDGTTYLATYEVAGWWAVRSWTDYDKTRCCITNVVIRRDA